MAKKTEVKAKVTVETEVTGLDTIKQKFQDIKKYAKEMADGLKNPETRIKTLKKLFNDFGGAVKNGLKKAGDAAKSVGSAVGKVGSAIGKLSVITAIGGAITGAFTKNQKVVDAFNKVINVVAIIFGKIADAIFNVFEEQGKMNGGFNATKAVVGGLITGALNIFLGALQGISYVIQNIQLAWEKSIFGDGDPTEIERLTKSIEETEEALAQTGKNIVESGKAVYNNFGEAISEVTDTLIAGTKAVSDTVAGLDMDQITSDADRLVQLAKAAALADAERQRIQLEYQRTAEQLRQLRDDDTKSIEDRQKANEDLLALLKEQAAEEEKQIRIKIANAQATYAITRNNEDLVALKQAELELTDLQERLEGQKSEALTNQNSLLREQKAIQQSTTAAQLDALETNLDALAQLEKNSLKRMEMELKNIDIVKTARLAAIDDELASTAEGTARYQELLNQRALIEDEFNNASVAKTKEVEEEKKRVREVNEAALLNLATTTFSAIDQIAQATAGDDEVRKKKAFELSKKLNIANAIISTYAGINATLKDESLPTVAKIAAAVGIGIAGFANVVKIKNTQYSGSGGGGKVSPIKPVNPNAAFEGGTAGNNTVTRETQQPVMKTYVLESDVTSAQMASKRIKDRARL